MRLTPFFLVTLFVRFGHVVSQDLVQDIPSNDGPFGPVQSNKHLVNMDTSNPGPVGANSNGALKPDLSGPPGTDLSGPSRYRYKPKSPPQPSPSAPVEPNPNPPFQPLAPFQPPVSNIPAQLPALPPMPNVPVESPMPKVPAESPMPNLPIESPMPNVPAQPPMSNIPIQPPMPNMPLQPTNNPPQSKSCPACMSCENEGQESQFASGYYLCQNGVYMPLACATDDGSRIEIGSTYTKPYFYFYMQCQLVNQNGIHLVPIACKNQDKMIKPGETYEKNYFWYACYQKTPGTLAYEARGCVNEETGERVQANSTYKTSDFSYNCYRTPDGGIYAEPRGCMVEGKEYPVNADVESQSKSCWYRCFRMPDGLQLRVMGCLEGGKKYEVGESITIRDYVYKCVRNQTDESVTREPVGCVETGKDGSAIAHGFGERWVEGASNPKYVFECRGDSKRIFKTSVQCVFDGPEGQGQIEGGCMRRFGTIVLQCYQGQNAVHGQIYPGAPPEFEEQAKPTGLKVC